MSRLVSAAADEPGEVVTVTWADGVSARFHAVWLRACSPDPGTRNASNGQRLTTANQLDLATRVAAVTMADDGAALTVCFAGGGPTACFAGDQLRAERYDVERPGGWAWTSERIERWTAATMRERVPRAEYAALRDDPAALARWLGAVERFGFAVVHGVPTRPGSVCDVAELFGFVRQTNYGRWFDVRARVEPHNLADTNLGLQAHTDNPYRDPVPTLQLLHCLENSVAGGASSVVDGYAAVARLLAEDPGAAHLLAGHPARFEYRGSADVLLRAKQPTIAVGTDGELLGVRFNNRSTAALVDVPFDEVPAYLAALARLGEIVDDPAMQVTFTLRPGDLFIVDNRRVMHSRTAFTGNGSRWLQGCYADVDGLLSTLGVLRGRALVELVEDVFARRGSAEYLGEQVTMAEHMLQSAALAERDGADDELLAAALLHDIGHFTADLGTYSPEATTDHCHETYGALAIDGLVSARVAQAVRLHVDAKRYLCAVDSSYVDQLSPASVHTLALQGGPMDPAEIARFEAQPHHADAVRVRRWDDAAKDPSVQAPPLAHFHRALRNAG